MKTNKLINAFLGVFLLFSICATAQSENKAIMAITGIDAKGMEYDAATITYIVRLEAEKTQKFMLIDKYEMAEAFQTAGLKMENCFSKTCLVNAGRLLNADKMLSGEIASIGGKIVISLRLIDVDSETVERTDAIEYLGVRGELQKMIEISVKRLFQMEPDPLLVSQLVDYNVPVSSPKTVLRLNGPRMGVSYTTGETGERMSAPKEEGGFDMYRSTFQFGYQQEVQYLTAGDFQALIEFVGLVGGFENGKIIPSLSMLNGFRFGKHGWEVAFGPSLRFTQRADGFFDTDGVLGEKGRWYLSNEWDKANLLDEEGNAMKNPYDIVSRLDSRGKLYGSTSLIVAAGRTFRSGYLNMPVNLYMSPRKEGWTYGISFGFNVSKKPTLK